MAEKKSIIEEALMDYEKIQKALNANTREILRSVAKEEIESLVKESILENDFEEDSIETDDDADSMEELPTEPADEFSSDDEVVDDMPIDDLGDSDEVEPEMGQDLGMGADTALDGDDLDMTASSDDEVIAIYKKLSGEDEVEIVGDDIHLTVNEPGEYVIKNTAAAGGNMGSEVADDELEEIPEIGMDADTEDGEGADYEIELDDDNGEVSFGAEETEEAGDEPEEIGAPSEEEETKEPADDEEIEEQITQNHVGANRAGGDLTQIKGPGARNIKESKEYKALLAESKALKVENEEFRKALNSFRTKLIETVVMNANLSYVARLISENATTKEEKRNIISRFDSEVTSLTESKKLYKTISNELVGRKSIVESVEQKIIKEGASSSSTKLNESTAYISPEIKRMKELFAYNPKN
jgi:hypothetical protein